MIRLLTVPGASRENRFRGDRELTISLRFSRGIVLFPKVLRKSNAILIVLTSPQLQVIPKGIQSNAGWDEGEERPRKPQLEIQVPCNAASHKLSPTGLERRVVDALPAGRKCSVLELHLFI